MLQIFHRANFQFMGTAKNVFMGFSAICMATAIAVIVVKGFNYGIDFAGGTAVQVRFAEEPQLEKLRQALDASGLQGVTLQSIGDPKDHEVLIRVERKGHVAPDVKGSEGGEVSAHVIAALKGLEGEAGSGRLDLNGASEAALRDWLAAHLSPPAAGGAAPAVGDQPTEAGAQATAASLARAIVNARTQRGGLFRDVSEVLAVPGVPQSLAPALREGAALGRFAVRSVDFVGPTAGRELMLNTLYAILAAVGLILLYIWVRFHRVTWGVAAVIALVHDVVISAGAVALFNKEFSLTVVAALLTIVGYSINDTIVVFDRIRENLRLYRDQDFERVVNASVNQTLSRTILTVFTVFIAVSALYMYGGEKLNPMSFCLLVGIIFGSYSSVFVAAALLVLAYRWRPARVRG
ncbi:MAG TPA: protein translocase subunit SecF [Candidatus Polarisedimenticolia bacterium]|jgi:preprotein translocase subunit SecF|nr:protein translocase subunit SecF [Candidatus Polarisedimenticolia bacterium]